MDENPYLENDGYYETLNKSEALKRMTPEQVDTYAARDSDGYDRRESKYRTCRSCGQTGYAGAYPFSTLGGAPTCDDCV